jgi:hypothetical protein
MEECSKSGPPHAKLGSTDAVWLLQNADNHADMAVY